ncbi:MAG: HAMP domain-containing histidine kinase [Lachnospiraceae bacterium]|nr:HAMP domain-containing histidine kinase [Lachnospiraceae bacterium]
MKKYKIIIILIIILYLGITIFGNRIIYNQYKDIESSGRDSFYLVEVNRMYESYLHNPELFQEITSQQNIPVETKEYRFIRRVSYLPVYTDFAGDKADSQKQMNEILEFYRQNNHYYSVIKPVFEQQKIRGYLRFDCLKSKAGNGIYLVFNFGVFVVFVVQFCILLYVYRKIIHPFHVLSEIPYELSKGNLRHDIKEEKSRYFGKFLWGIGMLKDSLEFHKQRELKLAKDKKMILLAISHDIKTPLHTIRLYAKALERGMYRTQEEQQEAAVKIQEKTAEIDGFVRDIIKSSTEDIISIEVENKEFYLKELVEKIQSGYGEKCSLNHIKLLIGDYDNYLLYGDLDKTYEAVGNLMENAFKYGDGIEIGIQFAEEESYLLLTVYNTGEPLEESEMPHLFESFYRGANAEGKPGNGLGLYICREIMLKMKGDIYAEGDDDGMSVTVVIKISG